MKTTILIASGMALSFLSTGCIATHKYVAKQITPVEQRLDAKNTEQDQKITAQGTQIETLDKDLSQTKEKLNDVDNKAAAAGTAAAAADSKAGAAATAASAADAKAQRGVDGAMQASKNTDTLKDDLRAGKMKMVKTDAVLFGLNRKNLNDEAKAQLDGIAQSLNGLGGYVVEIQGFTDKTGPAAYNDSLSQERAEAVARYLANQHNVPLRNINMLGTGEASGDQKTREERAQARKVEVRILVPEL